MTGRPSAAVELDGNDTRSAEDANAPIGPAAVVRWAGEERGKRASDLRKRWWAILGLNQ